MSFQRLEEKRKYSHLPDSDSNQSEPPGKQRVSQAARNSGKSRSQKLFPIRFGRNAVFRRDFNAETETQSRWSDCGSPANFETIPAVSKLEKRVPLPQIAANRFRSERSRRARVAHDAMSAECLPLFHFTGTLYPSPLPPPPPPPQQLYCFQCSE